MLSSFFTPDQPWCLYREIDFSTWPDGPGVVVSRHASPGDKKAAFFSKAENISDLGKRRQKFDQLSESEQNLVAGGGDLEFGFRATASHAEALIEKARLFDEYIEQYGCWPTGMKLRPSGSRY